MKDKSRLWLYVTGVIVLIALIVVGSFIFGKDESEVKESAVFSELTSNLASPTL